MTRLDRALDLADRAVVALELIAQALAEATSRKPKPSPKPRPQRALDDEEIRSRVLHSIRRAGAVRE